MELKDRSPTYGYFTYIGLKVVDFLQDEVFTVLEGTMGYVYGGKEGVMKTGESARLLRGIPHTFWNAEPSRILRQKVGATHYSGMSAAS